MDGEQGQSNGVNGASKKESLEQLLLARNKKLSSEMAILRVAHQELQRDLKRLQERASSTNAELERTQNLNATLENDMVSLQQEASNAFPMSARSVSSRFPTTPFIAKARRSSPTSSIISGFDPHSPYESSMDSLRAGEPMGGGSGILPMVQAQRDRFKQKSSQLESELSKQHTIVASLRQEIGSLQKDNLSLYEKTRYASTYSRAAQSSSASAYAPDPRSAVIDMSADTSSGLSMDRYRSAYEANISPFAAFRGREATRAYRRMSLPERIIFSVTRLVLANRTSRNLFAGYCVALHALVFLLLYWMQPADMQRHGGQLGEAAAVAAEMARKGEAAASHGEWLQEGLTGGKPG